VTGLQTRVAVDDAALADYADAMRDGARFPPVTVYEDADGTLYLADGYHRVGAAKIAGKSIILAEVTRGTFADALRHALGANAQHGLRRSNADKQHALEMAWENRRTLFGDNDPTADWLAETCGVSIATAKNFYGTISINYTDLTPVRQNADGRKYTVPTRPTAARMPQPVRPAPNAPQPPQERAARAGCYIAPDGTEHAAGVALDRFGVEIPERIAGAFKSEAVREIAGHLREVRAALRKMEATGDPALGRSLQHIAMTADALAKTVAASTAWCVCPVCQGNGCRACSDTGFQTEDQFKRNPPEVREERERRITR